jgi:O-6-methylguanine DNA methyltransferase
VTPRFVTRCFGSLALQLGFDPGRDLLVSVSLPENPPAHIRASDLQAALSALCDFSIPSPRSDADHFFRSELESIPRGQTRTYGEIARNGGTSARGIGSRCASNPLLLRIPCHRVIGRGGLGGYRAGLPWKNLLLELERDPHVFPPLSDLSPRLF